MRMRITIAAGLILIAAAGVFVWSLDSGHSLWTIGNKESALRAAAERNPSDGNARLALAEYLWGAKSHLEALTVLQDGVKQGGADTMLLRPLAQHYLDWADELNDAKKYKQAALYWQRIVDGGATDLDTRRKLCYSLRSSGDMDKAFAAYKAAREQYPDDPRLKAGQGYCLKQSGKYERALAQLAEASQAEPDNYWTHFWIGDDQRLLGDYAAALQSMRKARDLLPPESRGQFDDYIQYTEFLASPEPSGAHATRHSDFAERHLKQGRPDRAAAEYEAALKVMPPEYHLLEGWCQSRLAEFCSQTSRFDESLEHALRAVDAYTQGNDPNQLSFVYQHMSIDYERRAVLNPDRAEEFRDKAVHFAELQEQASKKSGNTHMQRHALADKGFALLERYGMNDARVKACRQEVRALIPKEGPIQDCSYEAVAIFEAQCCLKEENWDGAIRLYDRFLLNHLQSNSLSYARRVPDTYAIIATVYLRQKQYDEAIAMGQKGLDELARMRAMVGVDEFRRRVGGRTWYSVFNTIIRAALRKGDGDAAFNFSEEYKARALLDLLGGKADAKPFGQPMLLAKAGARTSAQDAVAEGSQPSKNDDRVLRDLVVEETHERRLAEDRSVAKRAVTSLDDVAPLKLEQLKPWASDFTFVTYLVSEGDAAALVLSSDGVTAVPFEDLARKTLQEEIEGLRQGLGIRGAVPRDLGVESSEGAAPKPDSTAELFEKNAKLLYEQLVEPVLPYVKTDMLIISPDDILNHVPFEALGKDGKYLIQDHAVSYAPSANVLKLCMDKNRNRRESVMALGNPNLKNPAFRLANAESEVMALQGMFPKADIYTFDQATESVVKAQAGEYDILNFACHGELNMDDPMLTSLRLAPDDANDGYLHAGEVFDLKLQASLVVLSACNSALGDLATGNELMGLTRSFLYAGAPSILASLWTVDDRSTAALMQAFYRNLATMNKAEALRQAKLELLKQYPSPFHWAAFCLQGDYR